MKKTVAAVVLTASVLIAWAGSLPARAADIREAVITPDLFTAPPAFAPPRPYNWTGVYIGLNAGAAWGRSDWLSAPDGTAGNYTLSGGLIGGTLGYNLQAGNSSFVLGVEVDLAATNIKGSIPAVIVPLTGIGPTAVACTPHCELRNPWLSTARLRLGYSFDWIMPYATAGVAIGRLEADIAGIPLGRQSANNLSWIIGGGVEIVISDPWTAKLEILHADLSGISCDISCGLTTVAINANENIVRAGLNYRIWNR